jgi:hypothetical protein
MPSDSLAKRHAVIANNRDCDVVVGRMVQFMDSGAAPEVRQRLLVDPRPTLGYLSGTSLARRKVFDRVGKFDPAPGATTFLDWVLRARHAGVRFCETDAVVLERRVHGGNISLDRPAMQAGYLMTLRRHFARQRNIDRGKC